jgi:photosystem II stability/assembly factor-like uncharacterized protein
MDFRILLISLLFHTFIFTPLRAQWTPLGSGVEAPNQIIFSLSVADADVVWAISSAFPELNDQLVRTTDGGQTWTAVPFDIDSSLYAISLHAMDSVNAWLTTADELNPISGKVYQTTDGGQTWEEQTDAFTGFNETPAGIHFWNESEGVAFGATCERDHEDQIAIYYTENGGDSWTAVSGDAMPEQLPNESMCLAGGNGYFDVVGDNVWFSTYQGRVFKSADRGKTWEAHVVVPETGRLTCLAFKDETNGIAGLFPDGATRTTDGGETWTPLSLPEFSPVGQIEYIPGSDGSYLIGNGFIAPSPDLLLTLDNGESWEVISTNTDLDCFEFLSPTVGFGGGVVTGPDSGGIYKWEGDLLTNILEPEAYTRMSVFPNPAVSTVQVSLPDWPAEGLFVRLVNAQGQSVQERWVKEQDEINVASLRPGLYSLMATADGQTYVGQFIKL